MKSVFQGWSFISNYEHHRLGRIWIVCNDEVRSTPLYKTDQLITISVSVEGQIEELFCTFVYASNSQEERKILWEDLRVRKDSPLFRNKK